MSDRDARAWIDRLVDGEPLDWPALERAFGPDSPALARMRRMAVLCAALTAAHPARGHATPEPAVNGFRWGHLQVHTRIGQGSSGEVYRAFDTVLEREVALKLIDGERLHGRAFLAEARRLAQVRHPNVLAVHGAAVHNGRAGLWADLIAGRSLRAWVEDEGARPVPDVLAIGRALASALAAVHAAGLVHGDVKPANVMREDGDGRIVLMDFGSAGSRAEAGRHGLLGSPLSMAPEQLRGEPVTSTADLYGLGVVLFQLLTGRLPIVATNAAEIERAHAMDAARTSALVLLHLPASLRRLLADLLGTEPSARPDARTVIECLNRIANAPQRRRRQFAGMAIVASLGLGLAAALIGLERARESERQAIAEHRRAETVNAFLIDVMAAPQATREGEQVRVVELLEQAVTRLEAGSMTDQPTVEADLWQTLGRSFSALDRNDSARNALERALSLHRALHGDDDPRTLEVERTLALELNVGLDPASSLERWRNLHARAIAATDPDHPLPALTSGAIGRLHLQLGQVEEARRWIEPVHQRRMQVRWQHPLDRSVIENHWLQLLQRLGDVDAMLEAARESRRWVEAHAGERHASALLARNIEIGALLQRGRLAEAEEQARALHELASGWLGEENPIALAALGSWASSLTEQGRTHESLPLQERLYVLTRQRHGADATMTQVPTLNLANVLRAERQWQRAETLYREVIDTLPERSDVALLARSNLAEMYLDQGRAALAEAKAAEARILLNDALGPAHLFSHHARAVLGAAMRADGRPEQALPELEAASADIDRFLGPDHQLTWKARYHLALTYIDLERHQEARALLDDVVEHRRARLGPDHVLTRAAAEALARLDGR